MVRWWPAVYLGGRLLRQDVAGWWTASYRGKRMPVPAGRVAAAAILPPEGWLIHPEQEELLPEPEEATA